MSEINRLIALGGVQQPDYTGLGNAIVKRREEQTQKNALQAIFASEDPERAALESGNAELAGQISSHRKAKQSQQGEQAKAAWQAAQWADTPEKWMQAQQHLQQTYGQDLSGVGFDQRERIIGMGNQMFRDNAPMKLGEKDRLIDPNTHKTLVEGAPEPVDYNKAILPDGTVNETFIKAQERIRAAGRPSTTVNVGADKSFSTALGGEAANILGSTSAAARGGAATLGTVNQIKQALATNKVTAGPGATAIQFFNQLAGGDPERLAATRDTMQGLAKLTLDSRGALKGQGTITDREQALLERAVSGDIDNLSIPEIRTVINTAERAARASIKTNRENVNRARQVPGSGSVVDFFDVPDPPAPAAAPAGNDGWGTPRVKQ
jgi:hypothetical protein